MIGVEEERVVEVPAHLLCRLRQRDDVHVRAFREPRIGPPQHAHLDVVGDAEFALERGVEGVVILDGKVPHAVVVELLTDHGAGTLITR